MAKLVIGRCPSPNRLMTELSWQELNAQQTLYLPIRGLHEKKAHAVVASMKGSIKEIILYDAFVTEDALTLLPAMVDALGEIEVVHEDSDFSPVQMKVLCACKPSLASKIRSAYILSKDLSKFCKSEI